MVAWLIPITSQNSPANLILRSDSSNQFLRMEQYTMKQWTRDDFMRIEHIDVLTIATDTAFWVYAEM